MLRPYVLHTQIISSPLTAVCIYGRIRAAKIRRSNAVSVSSELRVV
jgi:hypothetical protein